MKELIPLKKDIILKTKIGIITNINLEHEYKINEDIIDGNVVVSGTYKLTEASVLEEEFLYNIPFSISISRKVNTNTIKIDIDDFKYEILKDILKVKIDLLLTCEEIKEEVIEETKLEENNFIDEYFKEDIPVINNEIVNIKEEDNNMEITNEKETNITNITNNIINNEEKYYTYKIYNVKEGDTIETILAKYNTTLDMLKEYNDITNIKESDKLIIPYIDE